VTTDAQELTLRPSSRVPAAVRAMRPRQWVKNVLVFTAPLAAGRLFVPTVLLHTIAAFVASTICGPPQMRIWRSPQLPYLVTTSGSVPVWRTCRPRGGSGSG